MGFLFRFASAIALCAAVLAGVVDSIRIVASPAHALTPLSAVVEDIGTHLADDPEFRIAPQGTGIAAEALTFVLAQPAFAVFLAAAFLFWVIGYRRPRRTGPFAAAGR